MQYCWLGLSWDGVGIESEAATRKFRVVQIEGTRDVTRNTDFYNLDVDKMVV